MISITKSIVFSDEPKKYLMFQQVAEYSVLSRKLSVKAMLPKLKS